MSWQISSSNGYFYSQLYVPLDVGAHISRYASLNTSKVQYAEVGREEHERVFAEIVSSIHSYGVGLEDIKYYGLDGEPINTVLNDTEVLHMYEVAEIMTQFFMIGLIACILSILFFVLTLTKKIIWPSKNTLLGATFLVVGLSISLYLVVGFDALFTLMHAMLFTDAPWIFSVKKSLLVVLTKSPDYFAVLGFMIIVPATILYLAILGMFTSFFAVKKV